MLMDYPVQGSMGMMGTRSRVDCYDDGTHGDQVAGDGMYSYMDGDAHVGVHRADCPAGDYVFTFHGTDTMGRGTNTDDCRVSLR